MPRNVQEAISKLQLLNQQLAAENDACHARAQEIGSWSNSDFKIAMAFDADIGGALDEAIRQIAENWMPMDVSRTTCGLCYQQLEDVDLHDEPEVGGCWSRYENGQIIHVHPCNG